MRRANELATVALGVRAARPRLGRALRLRRAPRLTAEGLERKADPKAYVAKVEAPAAEVAAAE